LDEALRVFVQVNSFVGAFYDAVLLYAQAVHETLQDGLDPTNGTDVTIRMWNRTFQGIVPHDIGYDIGAFIRQGI